MNGAGLVAKIILDHITFPKPASFMSDHSEIMSLLTQAKLSYAETISCIYQRIRYRFWN